MNAPVRLAHLVSHPVPYFAPLYRELARRPEVDLTVYFYSAATLAGFYDEAFSAFVRWDTPLLEGYRSVVPDATPGPPSRQASWRIVGRAFADRPEAVWIHDYAHPNAWLAFLRSRAARVPFLVRDEQTLLHRRRLPKRVLKEVGLRVLLRNAYGLHIGEQNKRYLLRYGLAEKRLYPTRYCVDNTFFQGEAARLASGRDRVRNLFGIVDDSPVVLFCGKLVGKKQPELLVRAFARVRAHNPCWLLLVGEGPLRRDLERLVDRLEVPNVVMTGFLNQSEVANAYVAGDVFVLPSALHETWGLVVNEAMNFSLPVVVTDKVGCATDLVRPGWNGFIVNNASQDELVEALTALVRDSALRTQLGSNSRKLIGEYGIEACADGIVAACVDAAGSRRR